MDKLMDGHVNDTSSIELYKHVESVYMCFCSHFVLQNANATFKKGYDVTAFA